MTRVRIENDRTEAVRKAVVDNNINKALLEAALIIEGAAKLKCPVDIGELRSSIDHSSIVNDQIKIGTDVDYSVYVEYGTGKHAEGGGGRKTPWVYKHPKYGWIWTVGNVAQPFLRPALDENLEAIQKKMKEKYKVAIEKVTG